MHHAAAGLLMLALLPAPAAPGPDVAQAAGRPIDAQNPYQLARRAFVWGYPLVRAAQIRHHMTAPADPLRARAPGTYGAPINRFAHARALATPAMKQGVAPNNDTLYSLAWLDMNDGPFVLEAPDFGDRYYTFQFGQADSSTREALGQRTHGRRLPPVFIQGPGQAKAVPAGMVGVHADQRYLMVAGRTLVIGAADLPQVHALQDRIRLRRWEDFAAGRDAVPPLSAQRALLPPTLANDDPLRFLHMLGSVLRDWRASAEDAPLRAALEPIGLTIANGFRPGRLSAETRAALARGLRDGEAAVREKTFVLGRNVNGWSINAAGSTFGGDHLLRAAVAMDQIYVLPSPEALYPNARLDGDGQGLDGREAYQLHFPGDALPPVDAFWSITMYHARGLMVDNPIARYSIGDRTPGLVRDAEGGVRILLQHAAPPSASRANWLPAPAGPFMLMLRLYRPRASARDGNWQPPAIVRQHRRPARGNEADRPVATNSSH